MTELSEDIIAAGSYVIARKQNYSKVYKVTENGTLMFGKDKIEMREIIGKRFWTTFEMIPSKKGSRTFTLKVASKTEMWNELKDTISSGIDNRCITDDGTSQKLSKEEIIQLREAGKTGKEIINSLIENSKSFMDKTEYSQEKYIKKKEKKYFRYVTIHKPTISSLHEVFFKLDHNKIAGLRMDTLAQLLSYNDVQSDGTYILYDSGSHGLSAASILNRIGASTSGQLIHLHPGNGAQTLIVQAMNFPKEQTDRLITVNIYSFLRCYYQGSSSILENISKKISNLHSVPENSSQKEAVNNSQSVQNKETDNAECSEDTRTDDTQSTDCIEVTNTEEETLGTVDESETAQVVCDKVQCTDGTEELANGLKRKLEESEESTPVKKPRWLLDTERAVDLVQNCKARGLAVIAKEHPLSIVEALLPFLGISRPFVIFHNHREPLQETYVALKKRKNVVQLKLLSNFLRSYQVLPERTHPSILTSDTGGYLLTGYLVE